MIWPRSVCRKIRIKSVRFLLIKISVGSRFPKARCLSNSSHGGRSFRRLLPCNPDDEGTHGVLRHANHPRVIVFLNTMALQERTIDGKQWREKLTTCRCYAYVSKNLPFRELNGRAHPRLRSAYARV